VCIPPPEFFEQWTSTAQTRDGRSILIRPLRPDDREREVEFINSLSELSRYLRLWTPLKFLPPHLLDQLMDIDYDRRVALVATVQRASAERIVGIVRYGVTDQPDTAELGVTVTDAWQGCGVGRLLVIELIRFARWRGLRRLMGVVLAENRGMIALAHSVGFAVNFDAAEHLMRVSLDLDAQAGSAKPRGHCGEFPVSTNQPAP
jgi:RimJ/RimL family protein N-acetyltransferase